MISRINIGSLKPYFYQFLGSVLPQLVGIGISSVIVKNAGIEVFGQYSLLFALIAVTYGVLGSALDKDFQRSCDAGKVSIVLSSKFIVWVLLLPLLVFVALLTSFTVWAVLMLFVGILMRQSVETLVTYDRIREADYKAVMPRLLPVVVFLGLLYVSKASTVNGVAGLFALAWVVSGFYLMDLVRNIKFDFGKTFQLIRQVSPIWLSLLMTQVYGNLDLYVIKLFHTDKVVGTYKLAYTFAGMVMPIAGVFSFIFLSKMSSSLKNGNIENSRVVIKQQLLINALLGVGLILFMVFIFPYLAGYLYGAAGDDAIAPARILAIAMTLNMLTMVFSYVLLANFMEKTIAVMTVIGGVFYLAVSFMLVPRYAADGAAAAMAITYLFLLIAYYWLYRNKVDFNCIEG